MYFHFSGQQSFSPRLISAPGACVRVFWPEPFNISLFSETDLLVWNAVLLLIVFSKKIQKQGSNYLLVSVVLMWSSDTDQLLGAVGLQYKSAFGCRYSLNYFRDYNIRFTFVIIVIVFPWPAALFFLFLINLWRHNSFWWINQAVLLVVAAFTPVLSSANKSYQLETTTSCHGDGVYSCQYWKTTNTFKS